MSQEEHQLDRKSDSEPAPALFEVPNLDALDYEDSTKLEDVFALLHAYCVHKNEAMRLRSAGEVELACWVERTVESLYQRLPPEYRW